MRAPSFGIDADRTDRPAGWLTKTEREFLLGEWDPSGEGEEPTEAQKRAKKSDIRQRARHALADFALLHKYGDADLIDGIISRDASRDIYADTATLDHIAEGVLPFATDATLGEGSSKLLQEAVLADPDQAKALTEMFEAFREGDAKRIQEIMDGLVAEYGDLRKDL